MSWFGSKPRQLISSKEVWHLPAESCSGLHLNEVLEDMLSRLQALETPKPQTIWATDHEKLEKLERRVQMLIDEPIAEAMSKIKKGVQRSSKRGKK
jgi:hypothetical protein